MTSEGSRAPQRERGRARVASLTEAAAGVFAEKGYEAATMTEVAARAGAAIGSLYQFFPSKSALAEALHAEQSQDLSARLDSLRCGREPADVLGARMLGALSDFLVANPCFTSLSERRDMDPQHKRQRRDHIRAQIAGLLAAAQPPLPPGQPDVMAVIVLHLMRVMVAVSGETELPDRIAVLDGVAAMLTRHLRALAS